MILQPPNTKMVPLIINIATHNTRSFTLPHKQQILFNLYSLYNLDIIALQETNFNNPSHTNSLKFICSNKFVPFFNTGPSTQSMGFGVGFLVKKHIADHIFCHSSFFHRIYSIDFQFKNKQKLHIINIYISSSDRTLRNKTYKKASDLINEAHQQEFLTIILGDFNADPSRTSNPSNANAFFTSLDNLHMINNLDLVKNQKQKDDLITFESNTSHSTIDHIFMHSSLILDLIDQTVEKIDNDLSDHAIVYATISLKSINPSFTQNNAIKS
jgi:endonuclease/exonuclease/phosphatase family metal-dependent hydrolase